ncbi:MAG: DUF5317 domain-containing protein [Armatimonadota bacterium]
MKLAFEAGILSIIIALIRRGRLRRLADLEIKSLWLVFIPAFIIIVSMVLGKYLGKTILWSHLTGLLHIIASIAFLVFFWANRKLPGMKWFLAGWVLNLFPIVLNAGKMPVSEKAAAIAGVADVLNRSEGMRHIVMSGSAWSKFNFLGDTIPVPKLITDALPCGLSKVFSGIFSIGDVLMAVGIFILIQLTMCPKKSKTSRAAKEGCPD